MITIMLPNVNLYLNNLRKHYYNACKPDRYNKRTGNNLFKSAKLIFERTGPFRKYF